VILTNSSICLARVAAPAALVVVRRSADETKFSMHIKDSMRESCIAEVAGTWYSLAQAYKGSRPELAAFVLSSCARYVHWMDIGLVANDK
jgi:exportin-T